MSADDSKTLLSQFSRNRSEAAFRELVSLHSTLVYGTALRMLKGDRAAAEDVMQEVFTLLVKKAPGLGDVVLSGWLYRQACRRASNHARSESRRRRRELAVASSVMGSTVGPEYDSSQAALSEEIDGAILSLPAMDRDAVTMRFFEGRDYRSLGSSLGLSEEAARKRVTRALEKLAAILKRKGIVAGAASLGASMTGMAATPPPASVVSKVATQALKAMPAGATPGFLALLKPFLAGLFAASVVAGTFSIVRRSSSHPGPATPAPVASRRPLPPGAGQHDPASTGPGDPMEVVIAGIKQIKFLPGHILTDIHLEALLETIPVDQIAAFILVADGRLTINGFLLPAPHRPLDEDRRPGCDELRR